MEDKPNITPVLLISFLFSIFSSIIVLVIYKYANALTALGWCVGSVAYDVLKIYRLYRANKDLYNYIDNYINIVFMTLLFVVILVRG